MNHDTYIKGRAPFLDPAFVRGQGNWTTVDFDLSAGLVDEFVRIPGDLIYVDQHSTGFAYIETHIQTAGSLSPLLVSPGFTAAVDFTSIKLNAPAQPFKRLRLIVGNGVRILGGNFLGAETMQQARSQAFLAFGTATAAAGTYAGVQLHLPSTATKKIRIKQIQFSTHVAGYYRAYMNAEPNVLPAGMTPVNAEPSSPIAAQAQLLQGTNANINITGGFQFAAFRVSTAAATIWTPASPIVLSPGQNVGIWHDTIATGNSNTGFEWEEI